MSYVYVFGTKARSTAKMVQIADDKHTGQWTLR